MFDYLSFKKDAFGLDLSDLSIKAVYLKKDKKGFRTLSLGERSLSEGVMEDGRIRDKEALIGAIKGTLSDVKGQKIRTNKVIASLPEERAFLQVIQTPIMELSELEIAIPFEVEEYIPMSKDKIYMDYQFVPPVVDSLDHLDIMIAAIPRTIVDPYVDVLKEVGLKPIALEIEPQAIVRSVIKEGMTEERVLVVEMGATRTRFIIFAGYTIRFFSSSLVCSRTFDRAISEELGVSLKKAEEIKREYGLSKEVKINGQTVNLFDVMTPVLTDLSEQIEKFIRYYTSHATHEHLPETLKLSGGSLTTKEGVGKLILCGGGSALDGLSNFLEGRLEVKAKTVNPFESIKGLKPDNPLAYSTALGLAMKGKS